MNDDRDIERLSAYFDDEISDVERAVVNDLLKSSSASVTVLNEFRELSRLLHQLPCEEPGDDFSARVLQAAEREMLHGAAPQLQVSHGPRRRMLRGLIAAVCTVASVLIIVGVLSVRPSREPSAATDAKNDVRLARAAVSESAGNSRDQHVSVAERFPSKNMPATKRPALPLEVASSGPLEKQSPNRHRFALTPKQSAPTLLGGDQN